MNRITPQEPNRGVSLSWDDTDISRLRGSPRYSRSMGHSGVDQALGEPQRRVLGALVAVKDQLSGADIAGAQRVVQCGQHQRGGRPGVGGPADDRLANAPRTLASHNTPSPVRIR